MNSPQRLTAIIGIASDGGSSEESRANLIEALTLFFETAAPSEVARRSHNEIFVTQVEVRLGKQWEATTITVPVPLHDSLRRGTLASIVRQSGLSRSLFAAE